jgi:hypothetical protein
MVELKLSWTRDGSLRDTLGALVGWEAEPPRRIGNGEMARTMQAGYPKTWWRGCMRIQDNQVVGVSYLVIEDRRYWGYVKMEQKKEITFGL